jgi:hypothetical protein
LAGQSSDGWGVRDTLLGLTLAFSTIGAVFLGSSIWGFSNRCAAGSMDPSGSSQQSADHRRTSFSLAID